MSTIRSLFVHWPDGSGVQCLATDILIHGLPEAAIGDLLDLSNVHDLLKEKAVAMLGWEPKYYQVFQRTWSPVVGFRLDLHVKPVSEKAGPFVLTT